MYAVSADRVDIPSGPWQAAFVAGTVAIVVWTGARLGTRRPISVLWLVMAVDLASMVYMWAPSRDDATPVSWLLVAYFSAQSLLWATDRIRRVERRTLPGGWSVTSGGTVRATAAVPLVCYRDLRVTMSAMTLGMAYMFAATQLLR